jgi:hypothetical protein
MTKLALLLLALSACVADAKADIQDVCVTYSDIAVPAAQWGDTAIDQTFHEDDLGEVEQLAQYVTNLQFIRAEATAVSGITDFDFVQAAHVDVASDNPRSKLPQLDVYDCDGNCVPRGDTLTVPSDVQSSAIAYVQSGSIVVDLEMLGQPPTQDWTMDLDVCFRGQLDYQQSW